MHFFSYGANVSAMKLKIERYDLIIKPVLPSSAPQTREKNMIQI